jgi:hypothetical protein
MNFKTTIVFPLIVLAACANSNPPVYDGTLDPEAITERPSESQIYQIISISPETWAFMTKSERNAVLDHNCVFAKRNPDAVPGFDPSDCDRQN